MPYFLRAAMLPSHIQHSVGSRKVWFRGSITRPARSLVYASWSRSPVYCSTTTARLASGWWPTLAGRNSLYARSPEKGPNVKFQLFLHRLLLTQASPGARRVARRRQPGGPPQIRTCATHASGSSVHGFATLSLSVGVSLRC